MAARSFQKKKRNDVRRKRKPIMLISAEGKNKTEQLYFNSFREQHGKYVVKFVNIGDYTDPQGMLNAMKIAWEKNELSEEENGDKAYIVLDMDCNSEKIQQVKNLQKKTPYIKFITSNPCIEVWFICHFIYSTRQYRDSKEPKKELKKYIAGYKESIDISEKIRPKLKDAIKNTERLKVHYESLGVQWGDEECNPMSNVIEIIKELEVV